MAGMAYHNPSPLLAHASLQSYPSPSDLVDCSLPGPSIHGIFQARVLEWGAIAFSVSTCVGTSKSAPSIYTEGVNAMTA